MKIINLFVCLFVASLFSCSTVKRDVVQIGVWEPKENLKVLLDSFIIQFDKEDYIYELYIDKITPHDYNLYLYSGPTSLTQKENDYNNQTSLFAIRHRGKEINIYSGAEHYITNTRMEKKDIPSKHLNDDICLWAITDSVGVLSIYEKYKTGDAYPFIPFPLKVNSINFAIPVIAPD